MFDTKVYAQRYRQEHRDELREYQKKWEQKNRKRRREQARNRWHLHRDTTLIKNKQKGERYRQKLKLEILEHYSGGNPRCAKCGIGDMDVLCIDHIEGGGNKQRRELSQTKGGGSFYIQLRKLGYPNGFQILCANCNLKKQIELRK